VYDGLQSLIDEEARLALAEGNYHRAFRLFRRLLQIDPYDIHALRESGRIANALGRLHYAVEALGRVDELDGTASDPEIHYLRGESLHALGRKKEAEREFALAVRDLGAGPHDRRSTLWLARIAVLRGDVDGAMRLYEPLLADEHPGTETYAEVKLYQVEALILGRQWAAAERQLLDFLEVQPDHDRGRSLLAWVLEGRGKLDEELALRENHADEELERPRKTLEYARALERAYEYPEALAHYREAQSLGVAEAAEGITRLERRLSPELGGGATLLDDPSGTVVGWVAGATLPIGRLRLAVSAANESSSGGLTMHERTVTTGSGWAHWTARHGTALALGGTAQVDEDGSRYGGSAIGQTSPIRDVQLQVRGDVNLPWHESASTLRDRGVMDTLGAQLFVKSEVSHRRILASAAVQARRLGLEPLLAGAPDTRALQVFGAAGVDLTLSSRPDQVTRGEMFDRGMLNLRSLSTATVLSYRHYEMTSDDPFGSRLVLVERSSIDELSGVIRRVQSDGMVGAEVRGGLGYDWVRYVTQWRAGASLLVSATSWSRLTVDYDVASESGTGLTGRRHLGSVVFHVDL